MSPDDGNAAASASRRLLATAPAVPLLTDRGRFRLSFSKAVLATWICLFVAFALLFASFDLDYRIMLEKVPAVAGVELSPNGYVQGAVLTILLCAVSMAVATLLGVVSALGKLSGNPILFGLSTFYVSFFRGTPLLVQILLIYLGLPQIGPVPGAFVSGVTALSLNYGAYLSEVFRAGIIGVPKGQREAAQALGLSRWLIAWKIEFPQAMRTVIPPAGTYFIAMLKDSSLVSVMGLWEIMFLAQSYGRTSYKYVEMLTLAAIVYWVLSICLEAGQARLERHYGKAYSR